MIKAILFDMNGVIIDDEHIHEEAFRESVKKYGLNLSHEDYRICCAGKTDKAGYLGIAEKFRIDLPVHVLLQEKARLYLELFPTHKKSYVGVVVLIKRLAEDYTIALVSSSSRNEVGLVLKEFEIEKYFTVTVSGDDVVNGKPDPEPYIKTASILGLNPNKCLVIEDSPSGVRSAKVAGCYCIAIATTHGREELQEADMVVESFEEINKEMLEKIR